MTAETERLREDAARAKNWKRWGPYLAERQWATVREDYSPWGTCWDYFPHEQARSRAYRWGEDGILGITDRECRLCFALALWNGKDPILKERLFGLSGPEGNHGEDVKEAYFYLDATPTCSYLRGLYKYPQAEFPYAQLVEENKRRSRADAEFELVDTGVFEGGKYWDVVAEYAKHAPDDLLIRITISNRGPDRAPIHLLPTLWFRNTWSWGCTHEGCSLKPRLALQKDGSLIAIHDTLGVFFFHVNANPSQWLFTDNETNYEKLFDSENPNKFTKDAFHRHLIEGEKDAANPRMFGTKCAPVLFYEIDPGKSVVLEARLFSEKEVPASIFGSTFSTAFVQRKQEAEAFYQSLEKGKVKEQTRNVIRQGYAGLIWSKQFYHYVVKDWLLGDPGMPSPPSERMEGRNHDWQHLFTRDVLSMPDKWEYPWFAAWDLAFHMIPFAKIDPAFAKDQLKLMLREWYMHPNGQLPAYEFAFDDVNPPVHAWAAWRVYKISGKGGKRDRDFLESVFQKLLLNFTWWVNRKDVHGKNIFSGGFLGLDNIGAFDRSKPLPTGGYLQQADGTAWMAFYCATMLSMALELACEADRPHPAYEDMASKFLEHFVEIIHAMNTMGGTGLWHADDGFYYDQIQTPRRVIPLKTRSLVGLLPLIAVEVLETNEIKRLQGFHKRFEWFLKHRPELGQHVVENGNKRLLAIASRVNLERVLRYMLDEDEFLSPYGIRSLSKFHAEHPYEFTMGGEEHRVTYDPGESRTGLFGGNSNWRGPIWFPVNYLLIEALERYHHFYGNELKVECPVGSGNFMTLQEVACEIGHRLCRLFLPDDSAKRPCHGQETAFANDPHWRELVLFHEYFHAETG